MDTRLEIWFSGRVQGVGFRATVARLAAEFSVVGRVCNLSDGRVEVLAEGERSELLRFRALILDTLDRYIIDHVDNWSEPKRDWDSFEIGDDKFVSIRR